MRVPHGGPDADALAETADRHALRIAVTFGLCGDAEHVCALDTLPSEIAAELAALTALTRGRGRRRRASARRG